MRDVFITEHTFTYQNGLKAGSWHERGVKDQEFYAVLAKDMGLTEMDVYHVLLTRDEWNKIEDQLEDLDDRKRFEAEGS